ncbi:MAG: hypothetical protein GY925_03495 [Actinomycetia bacterium]|nr:hypothetical protein [Actinomycetes bacterium]
MIDGVVDASLAEIELSESDADVNRQVLGCSSALTDRGKEADHKKVEFPGVGEADGRRMLHALADYWEVHAGSLVPDDLELSLNKASLDREFNPGVILGGEGFGFWAYYQSEEGTSTGVFRLWADGPCASYEP